tara:strand:- start:2300 stop:2851 length:552 start_codon:yes stop_codon:yes gene_type:complete
MSSTSTYDASYPSICIPRTFPTISWQQVKTVFEVLFGVGSIERVDVVRKTAKDGSKFNCMFVHFVEWSSDEVSQDVRQKLLDGKTIKIVYDEPWYWKCSMSRIRRPEKRYIDNKPYIAWDAGASNTGAASNTGTASNTGAAAWHATDTSACATNADIPPTLQLPHAVLRHNASAYEFKSVFPD